MHCEAGTQATVPPSSGDTVLLHALSEWQLPGMQVWGIGKDPLYLKMDFLLSFVNTLQFEEEIGQIAREKPLFD